MQRKALTFLFLLCEAVLSAQLNYVCPLDPVTTLSGSYLELRRNHFHGGLDFRTGGSVNKPIYSVEDGYISSVRTEPRSYGKKVVITHKDGTESLYAHLNGFCGELYRRVRAGQERTQCFEVDMTFKPGEIPVKQGEQFAWSGNTGSSGGPHLHFELKKDGVLINPLDYNYVWKIQDNRKPIITAAKIYAEAGDGIVAGRSSVKYNTRIVGGERRLNGVYQINAWGDVRVAIKATDFKTGTHFYHSPRIIRLKVDGKLISEVDIKNVRFSDSRAMNSFIDYEQQQRTGEFFMRFSKDKNNPLVNIYAVLEGNGVIKVNEEREYNVVCEAVDDEGLTDRLFFTIKGSPATIPPRKPVAGQIITAGQPNIVEEDGVLMYLPENALYRDLPVQYSKKPSQKYYSAIHHIGSSATPVHTFCDLTLKVDNDTLANKNQYVIARVNEAGVLMKAVAATYDNGYVTAKVRDMGNFAVYKDNKAPNIGVLQLKNVRARNIIVLTMGDGLSGIASYRGEIDGKWVLFEYDAKTASVYCHLPTEGIEKNGKMKELKFTVTDACGNVATLTRKFIY